MSKTLTEISRSQYLEMKASIPSSLRGGDLYKHVNGRFGNNRALLFFSLRKREKDGNLDLGNMRRAILYEGFKVWIESWPKSRRVGA